MSIFRFKRFLICDDDASMKVGTDAVLLGAWTKVESATSILDIGTGCGVIAIMLAQRTNEDTIIDAVELLAPDAKQAQQNVSQSPWPGKVHIFHTDIKTFERKKKYDVIVSNPPYFTNSLLPPGKGRTVARHDSTLTSEILLDSVIRLLKPSGRLSLILPAQESIYFVTKAAQKGLYIIRHTRFFTRASKAQERSLMEFAFDTRFCEEDSLVLYESGERETSAYKKLTSDFYLDKPS